MIGFIEGIFGVAVVLIAGYFIAEHRDRIRQVANAMTVGLSAGQGLSDASHDSGEDQHHGHSHPMGPHWEAADSPPDNSHSG